MSWQDTHCDSCQIGVLGFCSWHGMHMRPFQNGASVGHAETHLYPSQYGVPGSLSLQETHYDPVQNGFSWFFS